MSQTNGRLFVTFLMHVINTIAYEKHKIIQRKQAKPA